MVVFVVVGRSVVVVVVEFGVGRVKGCERRDYQTMERAPRGCAPFFFFLRPS